MNINWKPLFVNVFWPAAAGNVFWSFCTLIIDTLPDDFDWKQFAWLLAFDFDIDWGIIARLAVLICIAAYLAVNWIRVKIARDNIELKYWVFDFVHLWTVIFAALTAYLNANFLEVFLAALFLWAVIGHLTGIFALGALNDEEKIKELRNSKSLAGANALGLAVLLFHFFAYENLLSAPLSILLVLVFWLRAGRLRVLIKAFNALDASRKHTL